MDEPKDRENDPVENPRDSGAGNFDAAREEDKAENDRWWEKQGVSGEVH